ncbi:MAG: nucleotidyltransferase domain-containing protein [Candidatus Cloacimonadales bacterium]|nr:nucleotidyltransferase domain-containing protein [Candidatus Cloacimonadales bacterium]
MQAMKTKKRTLRSIEPEIAQIIKKFASDSRHILKDSLVAEYLFGSFANNSQTKLSDIDILILVSQKTPELQWQLSGLASEYSLTYDLCISPILQDMEGWQKNQNAGTLFYQEVTTNGIQI